MHSSSTLPIPPPPALDPSHPSTRPPETRRRSAFYSRSSPATILSSTRVSLSQIVTFASVPSVRAFEAFCCLTGACALPEVDVAILAFSAMARSCCDGGCHLPLRKGIPFAS
ncbi:hypothetical protein GOP47_0015208 [Adiantum capillus-veneris]|uniref:Uncharacterized protein n=1 Tax=Adiantum capillus-veneris TaxID=13818 RepID=A0A9D4UN53_ADICA|nr:hypothetical protein GOP47_0015208 [Adiantum capillus-veneris]